MSTYVCLYNWTDQGIRDVKETTKRYETAKGLADKLGVKISSFYWTTGQYDLVAIMEAKDEESFAAFSLAIASSGNVRSTTLKAFSAEEMGRILSKM